MNTEIVELVRSIYPDSHVNGNILEIYPFKQEPNTAIIVGSDKEGVILWMTNNRDSDIKRDSSSPTPFSKSLSLFQVLKLILLVIEDRRKCNLELVRECEEALARELSNTPEEAARASVNTFGEAWLKEMYTPTPDISIFCDPFNL
jgi:hypothetical protein